VDCDVSANPLISGMQLLLRKNKNKQTNKKSLSYKKGNRKQAAGSGSLRTPIGNVRAQAMWGKALSGPLPQARGKVHQHVENHGAPTQQNPSDHRRS
jgi:hypothetical protein